MANLKVLKSRIKSVKSTQKITKAMKMVAASRLKKARNAVEASRPYADDLYKITKNISSDFFSKGSLLTDFPLLSGNGKSKCYLMVILSSDRGLCGGLNSSIVKFAKNRINHLVADGKEVKIVCIGKKAYEQLKPSYGKMIIDNIQGIFKKDVDYKIANEITNKIIERFNLEEFDFCELLYSKFNSAISQEPTLQQLIPCAINVDELNASNSADCFYEPNKKDVLTKLLPKNLEMQIYKSFLENIASEQGARMAAMEAASTNASKMIKNLTLVYNRTRQANITRELIDIVSGANAV